MEMTNKQAFIKGFRKALPDAEAAGVFVGVVVVGMGLTAIIAGLIFVVAWWW